MLHRFLRIHRHIDEAEGQLCGLAEQFLQPRRVLQSGHLHQDAVHPLTLDRRLHRAELVDAAFDNLDRLIDRLADALVHRRLSHPQPDQPASGIADVDAALPGAAEQAAERLRQLAQLGERLGNIRGVPNAHFDRIAARDEPGIADARIAQGAAHVITQRFHLLPAHRIGVDLEQDVRAALEIEPEDDVALRPFRQALEDRLATANSAPPQGR